MDLSAEQTRGILRSIMTQAARKPAKTALMRALADAGYKTLEAASLTGELLHAAATAEIDITLTFGKRPQETVKVPALEAPSWPGTRRSTPAPDHAAAVELLAVVLEEFLVHASGSPLMLDMVSRAQQHLNSAAVTAARDHAQRALLPPGSQELTDTVCAHLNSGGDIISQGAVRRYLAAFTNAYPDGILPTAITEDDRQLLAEGAGFSDSLPTRWMARRVHEVLLYPAVYDMFRELTAGQNRTLVAVHVDAAASCGVTTRTDEALATVLTASPPPAQCAGCGEQLGSHTQNLYLHTTGWWCAACCGRQPWGHGRWLFSGFARIDEGGAGWIGLPATSIEL